MEQNSNDINQQQDTNNINSEQQQQSAQQEQKKERKDPFQRILQKYLKINHFMLEIKHPKCKHNNGCLTQIIDLSLKGGAAGYGVKVILNLLGMILKKPAILAKKPYLIFMILIQKDNINHALFPGIYNFVLQTMTCLLNHCQIEVEDQKKQNLIDKSREILDPFISGFLAGFLSLMIKPQKNRAIWGLFLITRALECLYNQAVKKGYIPDTKFNWILIFSLLWVNQGYNIAMEPGNCPPSFQKFIGTQMNQDIGDYTFNKAWIYKKNMELMKTYGKDVKLMDPNILLKKPTKNVSLFGHKQYSI